MRTGTIRAGLGLLVAGVMITGSAAAAATPGHAGVQRLLERAVTEGGVPGVVANIRDRRGNWYGTAGAADTATGREREPSHRFRIGSATKSFVATVALQLVAEKKIRLDDTVEKWLPGLVHGNGHDGRGITVRQLLNHTSGIANYLAYRDEVNRYENPTPEQLVRVAMAHPPDFPAGENNWRYSNTNYILIGMITERATGAALADEIDRRIVRPLGLTGTYLPRGTDRTIRGPHSRHYTKVGSPDPNAPVYDITEMNSAPFWATGGMISSVDDLRRFFGALLAGRLLPPAQQRAMFADPKPTRDWTPNTRYGLGIYSVDLTCGRTVWGHGGHILGSVSYAFGAPDGRHMLAINVNADWAKGPWPDPIGIFTDVLEAEFCRGASRTP